LFSSPSFGPQQASTPTLFLFSMHLFLFHPSLKLKTAQFVEQISSPHKSKTETKRTSKVNQPQ
ncbi:hypothetical protein, partial [Klebsiella aerogenes]|uniref:hypothetical protein n=1 Tax=Klebsiella aerogenes TaxID=548 RepID=UPI001C6F2023